MLENSNSRNKEKGVRYIHLIGSNKRSQVYIEIKEVLLCSPEKRLSCLSPRTLYYSQCIFILNVLARKEVSLKQCYNYTVL